MGGRAERGGRWVAVFALVAAIAGAALIAFGVLSQDPEPASLEEPIGSTESTTPRDASGQRDGPPSVKPAEEVPLGPSKPVSISIPAIDVRSEVFAIGKTKDGALAVPQPGPNLDKAAWFKRSPTPGQPGPSIIEGHVATDEGGPSIFFDLAELRPGDTISVKREDGRTAVFTVDALREFDKDEFPTKLVYGGDLGVPSLRLITCSNFDPSSGSHTANLIVFSRLTKVIEG